MQNFCVFRDMYRTVAKVIGSCLICTQTKAPNRKCTGMMGHEIVTVDLFGPLPKGRGGVEYICLVLDMFTKFVKVYPIKKFSQVITENVMDCYVLEIGQPRKIISDNGPQFRSDKWKTLTYILGIELGYTAVYHPATNPVE
ncbi:hypothetical protein PR048_006408 [Dryococelus australis]|uniref:Integrase catalytic domain-containing protein n=1 Tax=Dryococelus australis TaxID=614101 RepID=A0ABQ9IAX1_9NEOP|nr:hypothetical protein PR048_006408 [Dryococelus australis]